MINNLIDILNSPAIAGLSNVGQLIDVALDFAEISNDEQLRLVIKEFRFQNEKYFYTLLKYCERILIENESKNKLNNKILENQNIIIDQNKKILSLLRGEE